MKHGKIAGNFIAVLAIICVVVCGAWGIYTIRNDYAVENIDEKVSSSFYVFDDEKTIVELIEPKQTSTLAESELIIQANAEGEIVTSGLSEQEKGYEEYLKEIETESKKAYIVTESVAETTEAETTTMTVMAGETETMTTVRETTAALPVICETTTKKQVETSSTMSIADIFKLMGYSDTSKGGETVETTTVDIDSITLPYELPYELPKPIG